MHLETGSGGRNLIEEDLLSSEGLFNQSGRFVIYKSLKIDIHTVWTRDLDNLNLAIVV